MLARACAPSPSGGARYRHFLRELEHRTEEYAHRLATLKDWAISEGIPVIECPYNPATWEEAAGRSGDAALADVQAARKEAQSATGEDASLRADVLSADPARREARCRAC